MWKLAFAFLLTMTVAEAQSYYGYQGQTYGDGMLYPRHGNLLINPRNGGVQQDMGGGQWLDVQTGRVTQTHQQPERQWGYSREWYYESPYDASGRLKYSKKGKRR
jgi:hypothetical protein